MNATCLVSEALNSHDKHEISSGPVVPRVMKQGWLSKRGERRDTWKKEEYFALWEDGKFMVFSSKPDGGVCCTTPRRIFLIRAVPCLGLFSGFDYYDYQAVKVPDNDNHVGCNDNCKNHHEHEVIVRVKKNTFSVRLAKDGRIVERTYEAKTLEERDEWTNAFSEVKKLLTRRQKHLEDFEIMSVLGAGYFGKVVLCREKSSGHPYAMKLIKKTRIAGLKELKFTLAEKHLLQKLTHPFLIHMKYSFQTPEKLCFVTEYLPGGELFRLVRNVGRFHEKATRFYSSEVITAIGFLHRCNVVYRDLKLENILIDKEGHIRLIDLGLCKALQSAFEKTRTYCGTRGCMAPEVLDYGLYGLPVDWWGVGIIMYEMLFGKLPFPDVDSPRELLKLIRTEEVQFTRKLEDDTQNVIRSLLQVDPTLRLGCGESDALEVQQHPFFKDVNWDDVNERKVPPPFIPELSSDFDTRYFDDRFTHAPLVSMTDDSQEQRLTSIERNKFDRISDYSEESDASC